MIKLNNGSTREISKREHTTVNLNKGIDCAPGINNGEQATRKLNNGGLRRHLK